MNCQSYNSANNIEENGLTGKLQKRVSPIFDKWGLLQFALIFFFCWIQNSRFVLQTKTPHFYNALHGFQCSFFQSICVGNSFGCIIFILGYCLCFNFQVLVGPSDWEDYSLGKEGAARYRVHNLPKSSGSGIYELGIAVSQTGLGREVGKLDPDQLVVAYLGQADNVRTRLQQYGRTGAHLGNSYANGCANDSKNVSLQKRLGLFDEILSRGYPIVFRWAPVSTSFLC